MRRGRIAIIGTWNHFMGCVGAALELRSNLSVRRFILNEETDTPKEMYAFDPDVIVVVGSSDQPVSQATHWHAEKGCAIINLDPIKPTMSFFCHTRGTPATLNNVLDAIRAARVITGAETVGNKEC